MASGWNDPDRRRMSRHARGRGTRTTATFTAPKITDEEMARRLQEEEENSLLESDRMTARHLQEDYSGREMYGDLATAARADNEERSEPAKSDEEYAREISDNQLAHKLQMEMDRELAARLTEDEMTKKSQGASSRGRIFRPALPIRVPRRGAPAADHTDGAAGHYVDNDGTLFIPEEYLPFFTDQPGGRNNGEIHPALRQMRPAFTENQWAAIQINPMNFLLQMLHGSTTSLAFASDEFSGNDYESLWELAESLGEVRNRGMTETELNVLPTSEYSGQDSPRDGDDETDDKDCKVCLTEFTPGDTLRTLPCCHKFHVQCIDQWMQMRAVCPICRLEVKENLTEHNVT